MMLLEVSGLNAFYGDLQAVYDLNFTVVERESVALLGANGAGKSTFLRSLVGLLDDRRGKVLFAGNDISSAPAESIVRLGLTMVPEGRMLFDSLTVEENLLMGTLNRRTAHGPFVGCSICSRFWRSAGIRCRVSCPADNSRWSPSGER